MKENQLADARREKREKEEKTRVISSLKQALGRIEELEAHFTAIKSLKQAQTQVVIEPRQSSGSSEAVAIAVATDWHLGSTVRPEQVNGLNKFDVAIAIKRAQTFFERVVRFTDKERQDIPIQELVLFLGGDLIEGALHLDTIQSNEIAEPINQVVVVQGLVEAGLNFLLNHGKFKRITVVCCDGNHGRITHRQHLTSPPSNTPPLYLL